MAPSNGYDHLPLGASRASPKKRSWLIITLALVLAACAVIIPVAVVFSSKHGPDSPSAASGSRSRRTGSAASTTLQNLAPKPKFNFAKQKMIGLNLGNWLVLERWMAEDWFVEKAGADSWDEWSFTAALGDKAPTVLGEHWQSWLTEADVEQVHQAGFNTFRVPTPFWMWIDTVSPEPYVTQGQLAHFERLCGYAYARNMYLIIDLHGLPGSQNGEQQSGHNTTEPTFFKPPQQARSDLTVKAVVDWIAQSPYYSIISAIEVANEPRPYTTEQRAMLWAFYERSYTTIQTLGEKAPAMLFSDGFVPGDKLSYWFDFAASHRTDPPSLMLTDHPYPGYFPAQTNPTDIFKQICTDTARYVNFPVPTTITEWSLRTGIQNSTFEKQFYAAQLSAWSWHAGSCFWSFKVLDSKVSVLADKVAQYQWSLQGLLERGSVVVPRNKDEPVESFLSELGNPCGTPQAWNPSASPPQTPEATKAVAAAAEAKALIDGINKSVAEAAKALKGGK